MDLSEYDPFSPSVLKDPYPWYRKLRDDAPCYYVPSRGFWVVTRYEDVVACARNVAVYSSTGGVSPHWEQRPMMPMYDPPRHTRLRRLVSRPFQPAAIARHAARIDAVAEELMTAALARGKCDVVDDLAVPLSLGVIAELIGVESTRHADLRRWSKGVVEDLAGGLDREGRERVEASRKEFVEFLRELIAERQENPDPNASDVISLILAAHDDDKLNEKETLAFCVLLLVAGYETTVNAIANGVLALLAYPGEWERWKASPDLTKTAIEELIRYDGPVQTFFRNALDDTSLHGVDIPRGSKVMLGFASANRDDRKYPDPDVLRLDRPTADHVGYGVGVHHCLGAPLARAQLSSLFGAFARRVKSFELDGEVERTYNVLFRGAKSLPIKLEAL